MKCFKGISKNNQTNKAKAMKSKKCPLNPVGQRSITSTLLVRPSKTKIDGTGIVESRASRPCSRLSLADYLNRKLHTSTVLPSSAQGKEQSKVSLLPGNHFNKIAEGESNKRTEVETKSLADGAFHMFKNVGLDKKDSWYPNAIHETDTSPLDDLQHMRKRKTPFEGHDAKPPTGKRLVVLGEASNRISRRKHIASTESKPLFNHYENGGGWWDDNREGVDNDEIGNNHAWEGVGSTSLGGLEWH